MWQEIAIGQRITSGTVESIERFVERALGPIGAGDDSSFLDDWRTREADLRSLAIHVQRPIPADGSAADVRAEVMALRTLDRERIVHLLREEMNPAPLPPGAKIRLRRVESDVLPSFGPVDGIFSVDHKSKRITFERLGPTERPKWIRKVSETGGEQIFPADASTRR